MDIKLPDIIFGTSGLGNLFVALDEESKFDIVKTSVELSQGTAVFDSAGKYGAGLALEVLGKCLERLDIPKDEVIISNKLGWIRTELLTAEPTFEPGVWKNLSNDAIQTISYKGILDCFEQGNELLQGYIPQMVSVHDPDEYVSRAENEAHALQLYDDILEAYKALNDLKKQGAVKAVGVGAKSWKIIQRIAGDVPLDWVMIANSMTIKSHPPDLLNFMAELKQKGIAILNSAVFHSGFLIGSDYYDYKKVSPETDPELYKWRSDFFSLCNEFNSKPAAACVQFAFKIPGVTSIALSTTNAKRIKENRELLHNEIPDEFWIALKDAGLVSIDVSQKSQFVNQ